MSRITKIQKYAVLWLDSQAKNAQEISDELNLTIKQINSVLVSKQPESAIQTKSKPMGKTSSRNLIMKETNNKQKVAIMSKEFSMINDELKKTTKPKKKKQNIFKINEKE
jgi:hypothetical protein